VAKVPEIAVPTVFTGESEQDDVTLPWQKGSMQIAIVFRNPTINAHQSFNDIRNTNPAPHSDHLRNEVAI